MPDTPDTTLNSESPASTSGIVVLPGPNPALISKTKPTKIYKFTSTGKLPKHTASSLLCKKANDHVISLKRMLHQQQTVDSTQQQTFKFYFELSKHPIQKSLKTISNQH
jgi:hypothetical protein